MNMRLDVTERPEAIGPARNRHGRPSPKATAIAFDPVSCLLRLFSPAIEQLPQGVLIDLKLLRRLAL